MDKTVLIIEDDIFLQQLEGQKIVKAGFNVLTSLNGKDAVDMLEKNTEIDLVLLDLLLPDIDGYEILKKIRASNTYKNTPVIIFSNLADEKDIEMGEKLGANEFMVKAKFTLDELVTKVKEYTEK